MSSSLSLSKIPCDYAGFVLCLGLGKNAFFLFKSKIYSGLWLKNKQPNSCSIFYDIALFSITFLVDAR